MQQGHQRPTADGRDQGDDQVVGIDDRANAELAATLFDYANERWAAHRTVNPQLWRLTSNFLNEASLSYLQKLFASPDLIENQAAALTCYYSSFQTAKDLLSHHPDLLAQVQQGQFSWSNI